MVFESTCWKIHYKSGHGIACLPWSDQVLVGVSCIGRGRIVINLLKIEFHPAVKFPWGKFKCEEDKVIIAGNCFSS